MWRTAGCSDVLPCHLCDLPNVGPGVRDAQQCCHRGCTTCGKTAAYCEADPFGPQNCCVANISAQAPSCLDSVAPCNIDPSTFTAQDPSPVRRATTVGVHVYDDGNMLQNITNRESAYGVKIDSILLFQPVLSLKWSYPKKYLDAGRKVDLVVEFVTSTPKYSPLLNITDGDFDPILTGFGTSAAKDGRDINLRLLHELNGDWYAWGALKANNSAAMFKAAFVHVVTVLRATGASNLKIQISYAAKNAQNSPIPLKEFYPGDEWCDQVTAFANKSICLAEMSSTPLCNGKVAWISDAWTKMASTYTQVTAIDWFFENVPSQNKTWDLMSQDEVDAWTTGLKDVRGTTELVLP
ncbi:glycoside hydrolase superfamily [Tribonema minus]|uniref:Glycoside hydrolase superfamily n=1 Tax=Tribonema minus TaxID=303371 RepID=A0A835Z0C7_9STRA|nr:glycoside hydrolase superfamily [Tribonema minus]